MKKRVLYPKTIWFITVSTVELVVTTISYSSLSELLLLELLLLLLELLLSLLLLLLELLLLSSFAVFFTSTALLFFPDPSFFSAYLLLTSLNLKLTDFGLLFFLFSFGSSSSSESGSAPGITALRLPPFKYFLLALLVGFSELSAVGCSPLPTGDEAPSSLLSLSSPNLYLGRSAAVVVKVLGLDSLLAFSNALFHSM